jgi:hypothetical protein
MKYDVNVALRIFHPRIRYQSHLYMLQALISDVATVIYQYCDGPFDEKILIGRVDASIAKKKRIQVVFTSVI